MAGKSLADLNAEAKRAPFVFPLDSGKSVTFPQLTFGDAIDITESTDNILDRLCALVSDADRDTLRTALQKSAPEVPGQVLDIVEEALGLGNGGASQAS